MPNLSFSTLDVFTDTRFAGNPLAVVRNADGLSDAQMQTIAREFNLAETVFVQTSQQPAHTAKVRIFTPALELPFAGHPTVGAAALLAEMRTPETNGERDALIVLELGIGTVRVGVRQRPGGAAFAEFDLPKLPERGAELPPSDRLAAALSLAPHEIGFENHRPTVFSAGVPFAFVPVGSMAAVKRAAVRGDVYAAVFREPLPGGVYVYSRQALSTASAFHARMFWPSAGVPEDPATGSAAAAFAGVVHQFDRPTDGLHKKIIEQGFEMGRASYIHLSLQIEAGALDMARIGGYAVRVSDGEIRL
jgi:trans-2,3-dihydro-3-hydroxyanthranilate isomerase